MLIASGNHDLDARDVAGEKTARWLQSARGASVHVDGDDYDVGDTRFMLCPWWDGPVGRAGLEERLTTAAAEVPGRWAWVYHSPPTGSPLSWDGRKEYGDEALGEWVARFQPDFVFAGHIHQAPFTDSGAWYDRIGTTYLFNAGRQPGPVPAHIVLDLSSGLATWYSIEGRESIELDAVPQRF